MLASGGLHSFAIVLLSPRSFLHKVLRNIESSVVRVRHSCYICSYFLSLLQVVAEYISGKRVGPAPISYHSNDERDFLLSDQEVLYLTWTLARNSTLPQTIPSWTGFNIILRKDIPVSKSLVGYLDCLDAPATDNATIYHLLCRSLMIKEKLGLSSMVCVYDQAIFAKAIEIQFKEKEIFKSLVLIMRGFHTLMMFLGIIGTRFKDAAL